MFELIALVLRLFQFILLARVLLSWFPNIDPYNPIVRIIFDLTEPVLKPVRELLRQYVPNTGMMDFSPLVVFMLIWVLLAFL